MNALACLSLLVVSFGHKSLCPWAHHHKNGDMSGCQNVFSLWFTVAFHWYRLVSDSNVTVWNRSKCFFFLLLHSIKTTSCLFGFFQCWENFPIMHTEIWFSESVCYRVTHNSKRQDKKASTNRFSFFKLYWWVPAEKTAFPWSREAAKKNRFLTGAMDLFILAGVSQFDL